MFVFPTDGAQAGRSAGKYKPIMPAVQFAKRGRRREVVKPRSVVTTKDLLRRNIEERIRMKKALAAGADPTTLALGQASQEALTMGIGMMPTMDEYFLDHLPAITAATSQQPPIASLFRVVERTGLGGASSTALVHDDFMPSYASWEETSPSDVSMGSNRAAQEEMDRLFVDTHDFNFSYLPDLLPTDVQDSALGYWQDPKAHYTDAEFERLFIEPTLGIGNMPDLDEMFAPMQ